MSFDNLAIQEFILARINDPEYAGKYPEEFKTMVMNVLEFHNRWPVMVYTEPEVTVPKGSGAAPEELFMRITQKINWMIEKEYKRKFGTEPPTNPMLQIIAAMWEWHRDYNDTWRL